MRKYGLIGYPISHSFSPGYFAGKYEKEGITDARYDLYPLEDIAMFEDLARTGVQGINVTIPYKEAVIPYLDELSPAAAEMKAVNVIDFRDGKLIGHNSDAYGFEHSIVPVWGDNQPQKALVLGTGGAAKAVWYVLKTLGISFLRVSRSKGDLSYEEVNSEVIGTHQLIVNTTPLGMSPKIDGYPQLPYEALTDEHILYDLVYNPAKTLFLKKGEEQGASIKNGHDMLRLQAERSWEIWNS